MIEMLLHIIVCKIDASGQFDGFDHLHAHLHPDRVSILTVVSILTMVYPNSGTNSGLHHDSAF